MTEDLMAGEVMMPIEEWRPPMLNKLTGHEDRADGSCPLCKVLIDAHQTLACNCGGRIHVARVWDQDLLGKPVTLCDFRCSGCDEQWAKKLKKRAKKETP